MKLFFKLTLIVSEQEIPTDLEAKQEQNIKELIEKLNYVSVPFPLKLAG